MDKLLALAAIVQNIYSRWLFRRLLSGMIAIAVMIIITAVLMSAVLIGGFCLAYQALVHMGIPSYTATFYVMALVMGTALLFLFIILILLRRLREMPRRLLRNKIPPVSQANDVANAFFEGFLGAQAK